MARPKYISNLHEAKYELRFCDGAQKKMALDRYRQALENASKESGFPGAQIEAAVVQDFGKWVRDEKLPKLPPPQK